MGFAFIRGDEVSAPHFGKHDLEKVDEAGF
jgi:hypothetical protein